MTGARIGAIFDDGDLRDLAARHAWQRWPDDPAMRAWFIDVACGDGAPITADDLEWAAEQLRRIEGAASIASGRA